MVASRRTSPATLWSALRAAASRCRGGKVGNTAERLGKLEKRLERMDSRARRTESQLAHLCRTGIAPVLHPIDAPESLLFTRVRFQSQNEEDGILLHLLTMLGEPLRRFVEIGCGTNGGNSGFLAGELGWSGLMVDARSRCVRSSRKRFAHNPRVVFVLDHVTPQNVDALVRSAGLDGEIDVLSIDIDSTDYWVFEALTVCRPRVVILEYNAYLGPDAALSVPPTADGTAYTRKGAPRGYFGASLRALTELAARKGYRLLCCEPRGANAFYLRDDLLPALPAVDVRTAFRPLRTDVGGKPERGIPRSSMEQAGLSFVEV